MANLPRGHTARQKANLGLGWEIMHEMLGDLESKLRDDFEDLSAGTDGHHNRIHDIIATRQSLLYLSVWYDPELCNLVDEIQRSYVLFFQRSERLRRDWSEHNHDWQVSKLKQLRGHAEYVKEGLPRLAAHPKCLISPHHIHELQQAAKEEELCQRVDYVADGDEKPQCVIEASALAIILCNVSTLAEVDAGQV